MLPHARSQVTESWGGMDERVRALEERVTELEALVGRLTAAVEVRDGGINMHAPLRVITADGRVLVEITDQPLPQVHVFNTEGVLAASFGVYANGRPYGGGLALYDTSGKRVCHLNVETYGARLLLMGSDDEGGVFLFGGDAGGQGGGGINIAHRTGDDGITLWSSATGGKITIAHPGRVTDDVSVLIVGDEAGGALGLYRCDGDTLLELPQE